MAIDIKKINVVLPEGVSKVGELSLQGNIAELTVVGSTVGVKNISASYDGGEAKQASFTVTDATLFNTLTLEPADKVYPGEVVKLVAAFSKVPVLEEVEILAPAGWAVKTPAAVKGNNVEAEYTAGTIITPNAGFTVTFRKGEAEKQVTIAVEAVDAVMGEITADPTTIKVGAKTKAIVNFDKQPELSKFAVQCPEGLTQDGAGKVVGNSIEVSFTGKTAGPAQIGFTYAEQSPKNITVTVEENIQVQAVDVDPKSVEVGKQAKVKVTL